MSDDIRPLRVHALNRTSPKGGPFVGTCSLCGKPNLTLADIYSECENPRGLTRDEALIERADAMSDDKLPPLHKVIAACKIGHKYFGPDTVDLAAAAWLERQQTEIERLRAAKSPISQFSDGELRNELHRRAQHFLGDPTKGISFPPSET